MMRPSERNRKLRNRRAMLILAGYFPVQDRRAQLVLAEHIWHLQTPEMVLKMFLPEKAVWEVAELEAVKAGLLPPQ